MDAFQSACGFFTDATFAFVSTRPICFWARTLTTWPTPLRRAGRVQILAALVCDPDEHATHICEQATRRATSCTALGTLLGEAISDVVYGRR
jgi:hypothetical protein